MGKLKVDVDGDQKPDFQIDFKTLILVGGMVVSMTSSYVMLKSEIEVAKTMPKIIAPADDTRVVNQKLEYLIREFEKSEERIKDLERRVYKK
tara:strand:- start:15 stop:290 length:276 start_codon:yes stop_codon:yes gene_type:complete